MRLQANITAPVFKIRDVYDREIDLNNYRDKRILIAFFRHAGCPFCNIRVHNLSKIQPQIKENGMEMIYFFESPKKVILWSTFHKEISPIPTISDPEKEWYGKYGLEESGYKSAMSHLTTFVQTAFDAYKKKLPIGMMKEGESIKTMPAEFLVDKGLLIKKVHYSERLNDRMNVDEIVRFSKDGSVEL